MLTFLKKFLSLKPRVIPEPAAPYKVEAPVPASAEAVRAPVKCGCGRSSTGDCVGLHALLQISGPLAIKIPIGL